MVVSVRLDKHRVAALWRNEEGYIDASGSVGHAEETTSVGRCIQLGAGPVVLAGELPPGAVAPALAQEVVVSGGYWMCVTSSRLQHRNPEISYVDADGDVFEDRVAFDGIPRLWPRQAPPGAQGVERGGGTEVLEGGGWRVETSDWGPFAPAAGEIAQRARDRGSHGAGATAGGQRPRAKARIRARGRGDVWAAVATCGGFTVTVKGHGDPPARLDLEM